MAVFIGFVDALPILGSGTVLVPWSIISFLDNDASLGFCLLGLYVFTLLAKQFIEPKIVSKNIGIHPIFTLIAMYTGFKFLGLIGLLAGPIILIIIKNVFSNSLDKGIVNAILDII
jgi:predicted PurR-regulated permease PerM